MYKRLVLVPCLFFVIVSVFFLYSIFFQPDFKCKDPLGCVTLGPDDPLKIGIIQSITGGASLIGNVQLKAMELAFFQRGNSVAGHPVKLIIEDEECTSEGGATAALKIVSDPDIIAVLGPTCSGAALSAGRIISEAGLVMLSGASSSPILTSMGSERGDGWFPGFFRTIPNAVDMGRASAFFAFHEAGAKKGAVIHDGDAFTRSNAEYFASQFKSFGGEIVFSGVINKGEKNMRPILTAVADSKADFLFFPVFMQEGMNLVSQSEDINMKGITLMGMGALLNDKFINSVGRKGKGVYLVLPAPPEKSEAHDRMLAGYKERYKGPPAANLYGYAFDAANLLCDVLEKIAQREKNNTIHFSRGALREALYETKGYAGITGNLKSTPFGDMGVPKHHIIQLDYPGAGMEGIKENLVYTYMPKVGAK